VKHEMSEVEKNNKLIQSIALLKRKRLKPSERMCYNDIDEEAFIAHFDFKDIFTSFM